MALTRLEHTKYSCSLLSRTISIIILIILAILMFYMSIIAEDYVEKAILFVYFLINVGLIYYLVKFLHIKNEILPNKYLIRDLEDIKGKTVAVAITYRDQDHEVITKTMNAVKKIKGVTKFYLIDNSIEKKNQNFAKDLCMRYGFEYAPSLQSKKISWKSDPLNDFLFNYLKEDYLVLIDKDELITDTSIITDNLPYMKNDTAYVQTMKMDKGDTILNKVLAAYNNFFYEIVEPVDGNAGYALFGGSVALMDVKKLREVGGFKTILEDIDISFKLLNKGYKGLFNPKSYSEAGESDLNYDYFTKRHYRYAYGTMDLFINYLKNIKNVRLGLHAKYIYSLLSPQFLSIFLLLASMYTLIVSTQNYPNLILTNSISGGIVILIFPLLILSLLSTFTKNNPLVGLMAFMINQSILFVRLRATLKAITRIKIPWNVKCKKDIETIWFVFATIGIVIMILSYANIYLFLICLTFWLLYVMPVIIYIILN